MINQFFIGFFCIDFRFLLLEKLFIPSNVFLLLHLKLWNLQNNGKKSQNFWIFYFTALFRSLVLALLLVTLPVSCFLISTKGNCFEATKNYACWQNSSITNYGKEIKLKFSKNRAQPGHSKNRNFDLGFQNTFKNFCGLRKLGGYFFFSEILKLMFFW